jgi:predicted aspartyl protease
MDFPRFDGNNPEEWLRMTEKYFGMVYVPENAKFDYAQMYITGKADTWLRNSGVLEENLTWKQFCDAAVQRFTTSSSYEAVEEFNSIKQGMTSVNEYTDKFEDKRSNYKKQNPDAKEAYYIKCYINGLRAEIKHYMKPLKPTTLYEAVDFARDMELATQATAQSQNKRVHPTGSNYRGSYSPQYSNKPKPSPDPPGAKKELEKPRTKPEAKFNEPGQCKYCGQKWFFGHRCQQYKTLNLMATEETQDSEEEQFHDSVNNDEQTEIPTPDATEQPQMMQISLQAVKGQTSQNTFTLSVLIGGKRVTALVDTGSTHTFIDLKLSTKLNCITTTNPLETVIVAGGGELQTGAHIADMDYHIQGQKFTNSFRILPLQGYDIVLGGDWLLTHSPVTFDYEARKIKLKWQGQKKIFLKDDSLRKGVQLLSMHKLQKALAKGATGYYLFPMTANTKPTPATCEDREIAQVLLEFADIFEEPTSLPPERDCDHSIPLHDNATPPSVRPYRVPHKQKDEMEQQIRQLLESSIIRPSKSPYASPAILVRKKDGSWRLCIDFRKLNALTIKNKFPIPVIEDLLDELHGAKYFTKLDLRSGYHQIRMNKQDIHKTAFRTYFGHFEYLVMPFGLTNAPATFQALMNTIFAEHMRKIMLVFFDDILIYSKSKQEHIQHLKTVLQVLRENKLFAKQSKCVFATPQVEYLGHIISDKGVSTDPQKIVAVKEWPTPQTITQLRSFLGLTGYYRRFVQNYGQICRPLHDMLKKNSFKWTEVQTKAFNTLKESLITAPLMALPDFSLPFTLETDASGTGVGAVLMQQGKPIAYYNRTLGTKSAAMSTYDKEALAILEALKKWRHYLLGSELYIKTDQKSLKFITDQKVAEGIQHKLLLKLLEFNYSIDYKKGKENKAADALSRRECQLMPTAVITPS